MLTTSIKVVGKTFNTWWKGDTKQPKDVEDEATPSPSMDDASSPKSTSSASSFTHTTNLNNNDVEKNDAPQDALLENNDEDTSQLVQKRFFLEQPPSGDTLEQHCNDDTKSIILCKDLQLVSRPVYLNKGKDVVEQQLSTSMKQLSLSNDAGLSLEGDVKNNSLSISRGSSIFDERRNLNPTESPPPNERLTPTRVSNLSTEETPALGGNNEGTIVLFSGNNDNEASSPGNDESVSWSDGDTVVNNELLAKERAILDERKAYVAEKEALLAEKKELQAFFLLKIKEKNKELAIAGDNNKEVKALLQEEFKSFEATYRSLSQQKQQLLEEIDYGKELILHSTERIETALFQIGRQMEKNHDELMDGQSALMDNQKQGFAKGGDKLDELIREVRDLNSKVELQSLAKQKKSNSYNPFNSRR